MGARELLATMNAQRVIKQAYAQFDPDRAANVVALWWVEYRKRRERMADDEAARTAYYSAARKSQIVGNRRPSPRDESGHAIPADTLVELLTDHCGRCARSLVECNCKHSVMSDGPQVIRHRVPPYVDCLDSERMRRLADRADGGQWSGPSIRHALFVDRPDCDDASAEPVEAPIVARLCRIKPGVKVHRSIDTPQAALLAKIRGQNHYVFRDYGRHYLAPYRSMQTALNPGPENVTADDHVPPAQSESIRVESPVRPVQNWPIRTWRDLPRLGTVLLHAAESL